MNEIEKYEYLDKDFYEDIKGVLQQARIRTYRNIQAEMVFAYWQIGKMIVEKQGGEIRANYGDELIEELSIQLTKDFGKNYSKRNLWFMKQFYLVFPKVNAVSSQLSWKHCRLLLKVEDEHDREAGLKNADI